MLNLSIPFIQIPLMPTSHKDPIHTLIDDTVKGLMILGHVRKTLAGRSVKSPGRFLFYFRVE